MMMMFSQFRLVCAKPNEVCANVTNVGSLVVGTFDLLCCSLAVVDDWDSAQLHSTPYWTVNYYPKILE